MRNQFSSYLITASLAVLLGACGGGTQTKCTTAAQCKLGQICSNGVCQTGGSGGGAGGGSGGGTAGGSGGGTAGGTGGGTAGGAGGGTAGGSGGGTAGGSGGGTAGGAGGGTAGGAGGGTAGGAGGGTAGGAGGGTAGGAGGGSAGGAGGGSAGGAGGGAAGGAGGGAAGGAGGGAAGGAGGGAAGGAGGGAGGGSVVVPANDTCTNAEAITITGGAGATTGTTAGANSNNGTGDPSCSSSANTGKDVVYSYTLMTAQDVTITATPASGSTLNPVVYVRKTGACTSALPADELGCTNPVAVVPASVFITNQQAGQYFIWVDSAVSTSGAFALTIATSAPTPPPGNDTCNMPTALTLVSGTATVSVDTRGAVGDYVGTCGGGNNAGREVVYSFTVNAASDVTITTTVDGGTPSTNPDGVLYARSSPCATGAELDCSDATSGGETLSFSTPDSGTYYIFVDSYTANSAGIQQLTVTAQPQVVLAGDICGTATVIAAPGTLSAQSTAGYKNDYSPATTAITCTPTSGGTTAYTENGPERVYSIVVGAGKTLTATVTPVAPSANADVAVYLIAPIANCVTSVLTCLGGDDNGFAGTAEVATYTNGTGSPVTVFIVIDGFSTTPYTFDLLTAIP